jgi:hypothetical protein
MKGTFAVSQKVDSSKHGLYLRDQLQATLHHLETINIKTIPTVATNRTTTTVDTSKTTITVDINKIK